MAKAAGSARAPRGTKIVARAFFAAADEIAEPYRPAVIKAALAAIREELKTVREKAVAARAKAKAPARSGSRAPSEIFAKAAAKPAKKVALASRKPKSPPVKRGRKAITSQSPQKPVLDPAPEAAEAGSEV